MDLGLKDATVLVGGGSTGMGRAVAECFAADEARVAIIARSRPGLDRAVEQLLSLGAPEALGLEADLSDVASVEAAVAEVHERWGSLNALVNAAGPFANCVKDFESYDDAEWQEVFGGVTLSAVRATRAALPLLRRASWARIVNVSADVDEATVGISRCLHGVQSGTHLSEQEPVDDPGQGGHLGQHVSPGTFASELAPVMYVFRADAAKAITGPISEGSPARSRWTWCPKSRPMNRMTS